jgi:peptidoglycan LD-endopeptidase LytH
VRSVVGPAPPSGLRSPVGSLRGPRPARSPRPARPERRGVKLSARVFILITFVAWGGLLALFDWGLGGLRQVRPLVKTMGHRDGPPAVVFPEHRAAAAAVPAVMRSSVHRSPVGPVASGASTSLSALGGLIVPVAGVSRDDLRDMFDEPRGGGRRHEAIDILAPRNTPILAAAAGTIDKLFDSKAGGITIYEREASGAYDLYYAHLESYAPGLDEGDTVEQGQVIGFVGTSGNAPKNTPHLHFAIFRLGPDKSWWKGEAVNPYPVLTGR